MKHILIYGDSNTFGCNPAASDGTRPQEPLRFGKSERWPGILQKELGEDYEVIEEGLPGRTAALVDPFDDFLRGTDSFQAVAHSHYPVDLLVFMLGTNDLKFARNARHVSLAMESLLKVAQNPTSWHQGKVPQVLLMAPAKLHENIEDSCFYGMYALETVAMSAQLAPLYHRLAEQYGCAFFDVSEVAEASCVDGIHLDRENHRKLALALAEKIRGLYPG